MSDQDSGQEKTEQPTERRLREAIEQGQVLTSKDLIMSAVLLAATLQFFFLGRLFFNEMVNTFRSGLDISGPLLRDIPLLAIVGDRFGSAVLVVLLFSAPLALTPIIVHSLFGGFHFTLENLAFKADRISPLAGLARMFGMQSLIELGKSILKVITVGAIGFWFLMSKLPEILGMSEFPFETAMESTGTLFLLTLLTLVGAIAVLGAFDAFIQWRQHNQKMLMSKQEMKDENKQTEGSPEIKSRIRRMQQEIAQRGSVAQVDQAQVIIVNPKRFAVALRYDFEDGTAPKVLAKGTDAVALSIREKAEALGVPVLTIPLLARALYYTSEIGAEIHSDLYRAVATVLSFVFQAAPGADVPEVEVPEELHFDANGRKMGANA
jgi:flagellar biosynthetic protein FlhB